MLIQLHVCFLDICFCIHNLPSQFLKGYLLEITNVVLAFHSFCYVEFLFGFEYCHNSLIWINKCFVIFNLGVHVLSKPRLIDKSAFCDELDQHGPITYGKGSPRYIILSKLYSCMISLKSTWSW